MKHADVTERIIKGFYKVYNTLGYGFLEKVYQNAMVIDLCRLGLDLEPQARIDVYYEGVQVGEYFADLFVNSCVIVELKAVETLVPIHLAQIISYLRATRIRLGLLVNFNVPLLLRNGVKRFILSP